MLEVEKVREKQKKKEQKGKAKNANQEQNKEKEKEKEKGKEAEKSGNDHLHWIFRRLSFISRMSEDGSKKQTYIFKWFAAMATQLTKDEVQPYLIPIIFPLFRLVENPNLSILIKKRPEVKDCKDLADQVMDIVKKKAGTVNFFKSYNIVRSKVIERRQERKRKTAFEAVMNPQKHAQKKIAKNLHKKVKRSAKKKSRFMG
eukprot:TRINITY_DN4875_c0_g1_i1.p1 TRINITY_DN4875_c0_g1~~TRINITY_DN4875_c0_g1_i1.p1  ORF type:complete len:236 (+),score=103.81 TRINITY_DN4875_c0_g1_i1:106-708(+)